MQIRWMTVAAATCLLFITSAVPNGQTPASVTAKPALAEPSIAADGSEIAFVSVATSGPLQLPAGRPGC